MADRESGAEIDINELALLIADILEKRLPQRECPACSSESAECALTPEEQTAVKEILRTKKNAVRVFLYVLGAIALWILKDIYFYISGHLAFR